MSVSPARPPGRVAGEAAVSGGATAAPVVGSRPPRIAPLDRLKVGLVGLIIAGHGVLAYGTLENAWPYQQVHEVQLGAVSNTAVNVIVVPIAMFAMGLFFLISGLVAPASLARRGAGSYARTRLLRLGVPLLVWTLVLWPAAVGLAQTAAGAGRWPWSQLGNENPPLDTGPMWFVLVLLVYSLVYAAPGRLLPGRSSGDGERRREAVSRRTLVRLAVIISAANVVVRPVLPAGGNELLQAHLWQWPQCVALFWLGTTASRDGWLTAIPTECRRLAGRLALGSLLGFVLVALALSATGTDGGLIFRSGLHWPALALALVEGPLAVGASVWLLGTAQLRLARPPGSLGRALARSAYAAFVLQGLVLVGLMIALRPVAVPAELKAILVALGGVTGSYGLAWVAVSRTPVGAVL